MDCCENQNILNVKSQTLCCNCGKIFDYTFVHEDNARDYNMNLSNMLQYKKIIYRRKKYLYKICYNIKEINNNVLLYFDKSLEIMKLYNLKRIPISKYLNTLYYFYCNKANILYNKINDKKY